VSEQTTTPPPRNPKTPRRFQFGLRTILILTLLACLGSSAYRRYNAYQAIDAIQSKAGFVRPAPKATGWRRIFSNDVYKVHHLSFHSSFSVADNDVAAITKLPWLRRLSLHRTAVTDKSASYVAKLTELEALSYQGTKLTDAGLAKLSKLKKLKSLSLKNTKIINDGAERLSGLTEMETLLLDGTQITSLRPFRDMKKLKRFELGYGAGQVIDRATLQYFEDMTELEQLHLLSDVSDSDFAHLKNASSLRELIMRSSKLHNATNEVWHRYPQLKTLHVGVTGNFEMEGHRNIQTLQIGQSVDSITLRDLPSLNHIHYAHSRLESLTIENCPRVQHLQVFGDDQIKLTNLPGLESIIMSHSGSLELQDVPNLQYVNIFANANFVRVSKSMMKSIANLESVESVTIHARAIEVEAIKYLQQLPSLKSLHIRIKEPLSDDYKEGYEILASLPNLRRLEVDGRFANDFFCYQLAKAKQLEEVYLLRARGIDQSNWSIILAAPKMQTLSVQGYDANGAAISRRYQAVPNNAAVDPKSRINVNGRTFQRFLIR